MDDFTPALAKDPDLKIWEALCDMERSARKVTSGKICFIKSFGSGISKNEIRLRKQIKEVCGRNEDVSPIILLKIVSVADHYLPGELNGVILNLLDKCGVKGSLFRTNVAEFLVSKGEYDQARTILDGASKISNISRWEFIHGLIDIHDGKFDIAKERFRRAYYFDDKFEPVYDELHKIDTDGEWLSRKYVSMLFNQGVVISQYGIGTGPVYELCKICSYMKDDSAGALEMIVSSEEYRSGNRDFVLAAARLYKNGKDYQKSIFEYERIDNGSDATFFIQLELADSYIRAGMVREALFICNKLSSICSNDRRLLETMIRVYAEAKDWYHLSKVVDVYLSEDYVDLEAYIISIASFVKAGMHSEANGLISKLGKLDDSRIYYYQSLNDFGLTRLRSAESLAKKACKMEPDNVSYQIHYAKICATISGRFSKMKKNRAKNIVNKILDIDPTNHDALILKKDLYELAGDYQSAYAICEQIIADNSKDSDVLKNCAELLEKMGRRKDATNMYRMALNTKKDPALFVKIIFSLMADRRNEDVVNFINEYDDSYGYLADVQVIKGNAQFALGRYKEAAESYGGAIDKEYDNHVIWHSKGLAEEMAGDYKSAEASFNKAVLMDLENPDYWISKALIHERKMEYKSAIDSLNNVIAIYPYNVLALVRKAMILARVGYEKDAVMFVDMASSIDANNISIKRIKRDICVHLKEYDAAITACKDILRNDTGDFDTTLLLSKLYIVEERYDEAINELIIANRIKTNNLEVLALMYETYSRFGRYRDAANVCGVIFSAGRDSLYAKRVLDNALVRF